MFVFFCLLFNHKLKHFKILSTVKSTIKARKSHALKMFRIKSVTRGQLTVVINTVFIFLIFLSKKYAIRFVNCCLQMLIGFEPIYLKLYTSCFVEGMTVDNFQK